MGREYITTWVMHFIKGCERMGGGKEMVFMFGGRRGRCAKEFGIIKILRESVSMRKEKNLIFRILHCLN